jgi:GntR family transcriptional repressor for pyruvate dehydrogenase complex
VARLQAGQLVEGQPGDGLVVCAPSPESVGRSMSLMLRLGLEPISHKKVLEVRRLIEVEIAKLAAERRTEADLERLAEILAGAERCREDPVCFPQIDVEFHRALALATQNGLYVILMDAVADTLTDYRRVGFRVQDMPDRSLRHHRAIFEQVHAGSAEGACATMRDHLIEAEETIREAQAFFR